MNMFFIRDLLEVNKVNMLFYWRFLEVNKVNMFFIGDCLEVKKSEDVMIQIRTSYFCPIVIR